jgi:beta-galactosidase
VQFWAQPEVSGWGRLPMHALDHPSRLELDGDWRFQLLDNPQAATGDQWGRIAVPGCWTMQDVGDHPWYINWRMPWPQPPPWLPEHNPTGVYERAVDVRAEWAGKRIVLHVGAAESVLLVAVDGEPVGASKDSHLAAEFDLTGRLRPGERAVLRLTVVKWSDASYLEDQDHWWHAGITRPVFLYATDPLHLADVRVHADLTGELTVDAYAADRSGTLPEGWSVTATVGDRPLAVDEAGRAGRAAHVRGFVHAGHVRLTATVPDVRCWSGETP